MYFHFDYLNEQLRRAFPRRAEQAGVFVVSIADAPSAPEIVARRIDNEFKNSLAETLTETEKAFTLGFVAMVETIVVAIEGVSYVVILIIMAVAANTMAMTARERLSEYATLKALGFGPGPGGGDDHGRGAAARGIRGCHRDRRDAAGRAGFHAATISVFAKMPLVPQTYLLQAGCALVVGLVAGIVPAWRAARVKIVDGLRHVA
jgi:putative ABC transport system permease protein